MKLAPLLAQYLYANKRLDLPGLGSFRLDPSALPESDNAKHPKTFISGAITFENATIREAPDLVNYISTQANKIKALAAADLDSHLELIQQFLNIGKPFLLEGIGSLVKIRSGEYAFTSGEILPESMKDYSAREISSTSSSEQFIADYRKPINLGNDKVRWRRPIVILLTLAGIALAVWGGYTVYKMTSTQKNETVAKVEETVLVPDSTAVKQDSTAKDSSSIKPETITPVKKATPAGVMKYILEKANARRAFERVARLKGFFWPVQLETKDSVSYTLYLNIPCTYADTARIKDSLTALNGRRVYLEK